MYACRLCRVPLAASVGCAHCDPVRRNLVVVGEQDEDRPSLSGVGAEVVTELRSQLRRVRELLDKKPDEPRACARLIALSNAIAKVVGEVRKLQDDGISAIKLMSFAERAKIFVDWYTELPPAYRRLLSEQLTDFEARIAAPVAVTKRPEQPS